jgi:hypothetical protein
MALRVIWRGPYNIFLVTDRSIYYHMTWSDMNYLLYYTFYTWPYSGVCIVINTVLYNMFMNKGYKSKLYYGEFTKRLIIQLPWPQCWINNIESAFEVNCNRLFCFCFVCLFVFYTVLITMQTPLYGQVSIYMYIGAWERNCLWLFVYIVHGAEGHMARSI